MPSPEELDAYEEWKRRNGGIAPPPPDVAPEPVAEGLTPPPAADSSLMEAYQTWKQGLPSVHEPQARLRQPALTPVPTRTPTPTATPARVPDPFGLRQFTPEEIPSVRDLPPLGRYLSPEVAGWPRPGIRPVLPRRGISDRQTLQPELAKLMESLGLQDVAAEVTEGQVEPTTNLERVLAGLQMTGVGTARPVAGGFKEAGRVVGRAGSAARQATELAGERVRQAVPVKGTGRELDAISAAEAGPTVGQGQPGFGIGETPSQGSFGFGGKIAAQEPVPLIDAEKVAATQRLAAERAAGQREFPEAPTDAEFRQFVKEKTDEIAQLSPLERAHFQLDEARASLEATQARGLPAPKFGTRERAEFDAVRRAASAEGKPLIPKKVQIQKARQEVQKARIALRLAEKDAAEASGAGITPPPVPPVAAGETPGGWKASVGWFREFLKDPRRIEEVELQQVQRSGSRAERASRVEAAVERLLDQDYSSEEAIRLATKELSGELPTVLTGIQRVVTPAIRDALFNEVRFVLASEPLEMVSTHTALTNALLGKAIPRTPGTAGGSAYSRLVRVFGGEIAEAITKRQTLDEVIGLRAGKRTLQTTMGPGRVLAPGEAKTPGPFIEYPPEPPPLKIPIQKPLMPESPLAPFRELPSSQRQFERNLELRRALGKQPEPFIERPSTQEALNPPVRPLMPESAPAAFRELPALHSQAEREIDLQVFREMTGQAPPPEGPTAAGRLAMEDLPPDNIIKQVSFIPEETKDRMIRWAKNAGLTAVDFGNLLRGNMSGPDMSYLRQQAFLIPAHPINFTVSFKDALKAMWSREYAQGIDRAIRNHPYQQFYAGGPDFLRALDSPTAKAWEREEQFLILAGGDRPLQKLAQKMPWLNISNRAFVTGINVMNWRDYVHYVDTLLDMNQQIAAGTLRKYPSEVLNIKKSADTYAGMLADMSGRGPLGHLQKMSPALNAGFFSVRLNIGRLFSPRHMFHGDPMVRKQAIKNWLTAIGTYSGLLFAGQQMGLWDLETDPRSSDFMKLRIGRLRIDLWGGHQQFAVLYARLLPVMGGIKSIETGQVSDYDPVTGGAKFARTKASPLVSEVLTAWTGKDFKGSEIDRADWQRWLKDNAPLLVQDMMEGFEAEGLLGLGIGASGAFGIGVQAHEVTLSDVSKELYGLNYYDLPTKGYAGRSRERVRRELMRRVSPKERARMEQEDKEEKERAKELERERLRMFRETRPRFINPTPSPRFSP